MTLGIEAQLTVDRENNNNNNNEPSEGNMLS